MRTKLVENPRVSVDLSKGGRTKQSFRLDSDPNKLMKQYSKSGDQDIFKVTKDIARHGDFSEIPDFFSALLQVQEVQEEFMELPSRIRNHVNNSAEELLELLADPSRLEEAIELGLREASSDEALNIPQPPEPESRVQGGEDPPADPPNNTENQ